MENEVKMFVWSVGEKPERSHKLDKAKATALEEKPLIDLTFTDFSHLDKESIRHRDEANNKLNMRYMVQQVSQNPFLQGTNYMDDLENQEKFLRPKQQS